MSLTVTIHLELDETATEDDQEALAMQWESYFQRRIGGYHIASVSVVSDGDQ